MMRRLRGRAHRTLYSRERRNNRNTRRCVTVANENANASGILILPPKRNSPQKIRKYREWLGCWNPIGKTQHPQKSPPPKTYRSLYSWRRRTAPFNPASLKTSHETLTLILYSRTLLDLLTEDKDLL
ncbi:unnamed protein product [Ectocarpus sp. 13 AM-2016]